MKKRMISYHFNAYALSGELDLNRIAQQLDIYRRFRWEEPMRLDLSTMVLANELPDNNFVYLYFFGGVVFCNCSTETITNFLGRIAKQLPERKDAPPIEYHDEYSLHISEDTEQAITNDYASLTRVDQTYFDIISFVIAKSVALERIEDQIDKVLDKMESLISQLDRGKLAVPDRQLAKLAAAILNFKYRSISHIMVLDKPEVTWEHQEADLLYLTLANNFELDQRYQEIKHKSETLLDITEVFSSLSHARREARLEWIIIILIAIEIVIYLLEILLRRS